jgi:hypothetical protein
VRPADSEGEALQVVRCCGGRKYFDSLSGFCSADFKLVVGKPETRTSPQGDGARAVGRTASGTVYNSSDSESESKSVSINHWRNTSLCQPEPGRPRAGPRGDAAAVTRTTRLAGTAEAGSGVSGRARTACAT